MNSLILHSFRRCPFAIRVRMLLEEKQLPYQLIEENLSHPSPELLSLHPEGRVPLLVHQFENQRQIIYQSSIITEYLEEAFPQPSFTPKAPIARAQIRIWTYWCDYLFKPNLDLYKYEQASLNKTAHLELQLQLHKQLSHWDSALQNNPFLLGTKMSLADIHLFPFARQFLAIQPSFPEVGKYTHFSEWLSLMITRPAFERTMRK